MILTREQVQRLTGDADRWTDALNNAIQRWNISTADRLAMFLAQCAHESGGFKLLVENLRYSKEALVKTWPTRFTAEDAARMEYDERAIAERAYGGRMGNAMEGLGDGYRFRGRGIIQLTGRDNYTRCGQAIGLDLAAHPEMLEQPLWAAVSAGWFWATNGCNELADKGDYLAVTKRINGGTNGLQDRETWLATVRTVLGPTRPGGAPTPTPQQPAVAGQPLQPKENRMGGLAAAGLIGQLLQTVLQAASPVLQAKVEKAAAKVTDEAGAKMFAEGLMGVASQMGLGTPIQAAAALTAGTPEAQVKLAQFEQAASVKLDEMAPFFDQIAKLEQAAWAATEDSKDRAAVRNDNPNGWKARFEQLKHTQQTSSAALIGVIGLAIIVALIKQDMPGEGIMVLVTALVMANVNTLRDIAGYLWGGVFKSGAAAEAEEEVRARRNQGAKQ